MSCSRLSADREKTVYHLSNFICDCSSCLFESAVPNNRGESNRCWKCQPLSWFCLFFRIEDRGPCGRGTLSSSPVLRGSRLCRKLFSAKLTRWKWNDWSRTKMLIDFINPDQATSLSIRPTTSLITTAPSVAIFLLVIEQHYILLLWMIRLTSLTNGLSLFGTMFLGTT